VIAASGPVRVITAEDIAAALTYPDLVEALREAFRGDAAVPVRHHHTVPQPGRAATLLLMPAWTRAEATDGQSGQPFLGCKIVTVFPDNVAAGKPSLHGSYLLLSGTTGEPLAIMDGRALTAWRTAAASALAASFLARSDAEHLAMIGAGALAPHLIRAHAAVRPIKRVTLWNRTHSRAVSLAFGLAVTGVEVMIADDLESAVADADIVCCATLASEPLVRGRWLKAGSHVDLVGGYTLKMREADDGAVKRARVYVDTRAGALKEAGDVVIPIRRRVIAKKDIRGDLFDLCRGTAKGRSSDKQITLFKSVGTALEDLAAAMLVWAKASKLKS
jgi:alanine dehydrogenase